MTPGKYFPNGDQTPLTPLFPFGWGLSYTTFNFYNFSVQASLPPSASGRRLEELSIDLRIKVANQGLRAGATVAIATYSKLTRRVVRNVRETCGFAKAVLQAGETRELAIQIRLRDLARFDPLMTPPAAHEQPGAKQSRRAGQGSMTGAWVVDGGEYIFFLAPCVTNPALRDLHHQGDPLCNYSSAIDGVKVTVGQEGETFGIYL